MAAVVAILRVNMLVPGALGATANSVDPNDAGYSVIACGQFHGL